jgi:hypothetical protein
MDCHHEIHGYIDEIKMAVKDSFSAMILSCLAVCDSDALDHMNSVRLVMDGSLRTDETEYRQARIDIVKNTIALLQEEVDFAELMNS